jgi:HEPN domain-containing protein
MDRKAAAFIALAREDLAAAGRLRRDLPRQAAFHVEQAAEKLIKAVLTTEGRTYPATHHQLGQLAALLPPDHAWRADLAALDKHTSAATALCYPSPGGHLPAPPDPATLAEDLREIERLLPELEDWCRER